MGREPIFVDTGVWIALFFARDALHRKAQVALERAQGRRLLTTSAVLLETLDGFASHGLRHLAAPLRQTIQASHQLEVVHVDATLFGRGWDLYQSRGDKSWSLTDCISFVVMQERGLSEALAHDQHFVQAGFRALLRD